MRTFAGWHDWQDATTELSQILPRDTIARLKSAYQFADVYHGEQTRPAGEPYRSHLLEVLQILAFEAKVTSVPLLEASLLHDVIEDTSASFAQLRDRFGAETAELVAQVSLRPPGPGEDKQQVRRTFFSALPQAPRPVRQLKLADRYSNVQRLHTHPRANKQQSYFRETCQYFLPVAATEPVFNPLYISWRASYDYLAAGDETPAASASPAAIRDRSTR